jgi:hypothetical protein
MLTAIPPAAQSRNGNFDSGPFRDSNHGTTKRAVNESGLQQRGIAGQEEAGG